MKRCYIVYTPMGDWRDIYATSEWQAKRMVYEITFGRVSINQMTAVVRS